MLFKKRDPEVKELQDRVFTLEQYAKSLESEYQYLLGRYQKCLYSEFCRCCVYGEEVEYHEFPQFRETAEKRTEYLCKKGLGCPDFQKKGESVLKARR